MIFGVGPGFDMLNELLLLSLAPIVVRPPLLPSPLTLEVAETVTFGLTNC